MAITIAPPDNEFAAASGDHVNWDPDWSYFDHPPNSTKNLTITSNSGDLDPYEFETGETYDISWTGHGGGNMDDAVVIRSDYLAPGEGAVVFEGVNSVTGELFQMVWTPGFDLEAWYWDNGGGPSSPNAFWTSDQDPENFQYICYAKGTRIDTPHGPRRVETLRAGDLVLTLDHGPQELLWTRTDDQALKDAETSSKPVLIRAGALGPDRPTRDLIVSPQHRILVGGQGQIEGPFTDECFAPAKALTDLPGVRLMKGKRAMTWVHFACARHEVVFANGCASESLLLGPMTLQTFTRAELVQVVGLFGARGSQAEALNGAPARSCLNDGLVRRKIAEHLERQKDRMAQEIRKWDDDLAKEKSEAESLGAASSNGQKAGLKHAS